MVYDPELIARLRDLVQEWRTEGWTQQANGRAELRDELWACADELEEAIEDAVH